MKYIKTPPHSYNTHHVSITFTVLVGFLLVQLLTSGCSSFSMQEVHTLLEAGTPEEAFAYIEEEGPKEDSLWADTRRFTKESGFLFERGLVAHYAKRFSESNRDFSVTEDITKGYSGTRYERLMRHYYRILNYVYLNQLEQALVECRRAMVFINDSEDENNDYAFLGAGLLAHLSGMCFEAAGEWNDAFISYQQAETFYQHASSKTEINIPADVGKALVRLARRLELANEASRYQRQYGEPDTHSDGMGELVLFYESGYVPAKSEEELSFPILKIDAEKDAFRRDNRRNKAIAESFVVNTLLAREVQFHSDRELEYVLSISMPAMSSNRPYLAGIVVQANNIQQSGVLVGDIETMAVETLNAKRPTLLSDTLMDVFFRYLTYRVEKPEADAYAAETKELQKQREKEVKEMQQSDLSPAEKAQLSILAKQVSKTEDTIGRALYDVKPIRMRPADTRSWRMLPNQIFLIRMPLPEGTHNVTLSFLDANGQNTGSQILRDVEISPNRITFLNYRTYK